MKRTVTLTSDPCDEKLCTPSPPDTKKPCSKLKNEQVTDDVLGFATRVLPYPTGYFVKPVIHDRQVILSHMMDKNLVRHANTELGKELLNVRDTAIKFLLRTREVESKTFGHIMQQHQSRWFANLTQVDSVLCGIDDVAVGILNYDTIKAILNAGYTCGSGNSFVVYKLATCMKWTMDYKEFFTYIGEEQQTCKLVHIRFDDENKGYVFGATKCPATRSGTVIERYIGWDADESVTEVEIQKDCDY